MKPSASGWKRALLVFERLDGRRLPLMPDLMCEVAYQ
jgi:hypothetical protein